jgi:hypothetical protein
VPQLDDDDCVLRPATWRAAFSAGIGECGKLNALDRDRHLLDNRQGNGDQAASWKMMPSV